VGYPRREEGRQILNRFRFRDPLDGVEPVASPEDIGKIRDLVREIYVDAKVQDYILEIVEQSRHSKFVRLGASPRSSQHLQLAAQAWALMNGRGFVVPKDVLSVAVPVLSHRLVLSTEAKLAHKSAVEVMEHVVRSSSVPVGIKI
jgi:MoxR-like ATPase